MSASYYHALNAGIPAITTEMLSTPRDIPSFGTVPEMAKWSASIGHTLDAVVFSYPSYPVEASNDRICFGKDLSLGGRSYLVCSKCGNADWLDAKSPKPINMLCLMPHKYFADNDPCPLSYAISSQNVYCDECLYSELRNNKICAHPDPTHFTYFDESSQRWFLARGDFPDDSQRYAYTKRASHHF